MAAGGNDHLVKGLPGSPSLQGNLVITDTDQVTSLLTLNVANGNLSVAGTVTSAGAVDSGGNLALAGNIAVNTNKFNVTGSNGNTAVAGTLAVTGASSLAAVSASGLVTSTVAAGSPVLKAILTNATPTVAFGADASHNPSTAPAGFLQIVVGSTTYYIPVWA